MEQLTPTDKKGISDRIAKLGRRAHLVTDAQHLRVILLSFPPDVRRKVFDDVRSKLGYKAVWPFDV